MARDSRGLLGSYVTAVRASDSVLLRAYVLTSAAVGLFVALLLLLGLVSWFAEPAPLGQRALLGVIALLVLVPLSAPVLVVASRHGRGIADRRADAALALAGFGFVAAGYLALLISDPNPHPVSGPLAPVVAAVDALPRAAWIVPPVGSVLGLYLAVRWTRSGSTGDLEEAEA